MRSDWLTRHGVTVCEEWAVPPPPGATLADVTAAARPACARSWRRAGGSADALDWGIMGPEADLAADAVFDCRGLRPNTREAYADGAAEWDPASGDVPSRRFGLPDGVVGRSGWLRVDDRFRLCTREYDDNAAAAR